MPAAAQKAPTVAGYVLGVDDAISVSVFGAPEASVSTRIKHDGTIVMPMIGSLNATGETNVSLAAAIRKKLISGNFYKDPIVNVEILTYSSRVVSVAGNIGSPGLYPLDKPYRVSDVLLKAGWIRGAQTVYLRRASDGKEIKLDTLELVRGTPDKDPYLEAGDTLYVPDVDYIYMQGAVARPGPVAVLPNMTLREALAMAGGVSALGSDKKVSLVRGTSKEVNANLDDKVQAKDIYVFKEKLF
ncbi:MAG: polysaccharide biosynthesis/export family protein [Polymorphobacter sp.]